MARSQFENDTWKLAQARVISVTAGTPRNILYTTALMSVSGASGDTYITVDTINGEFDPTGTITIDAEEVAYTACTWIGDGTAVITCSPTQAHDVGIVVYAWREPMADRLGVVIDNRTGGNAWIGFDGMIRNTPVRGQLLANAASKTIQVDATENIFVDAASSGKIGIIEYA